MTDIVTRLEEMAAKVQLEALQAPFNPTVKAPTNPTAELLQEAANVIKAMSIKLADLHIALALEERAKNNS